MMNNGLFRGEMAGASANQMEEGPRKPEDLAQEISLVWDQLQKHIRIDLWRSSDQYLFRTLCELVVQSKTLSLASREQPFDTKITSSWLAVIDKVQKLFAIFGLSPKSGETVEFERWTNHDRN